MLHPHSFAFAAIFEGFTQAHGIYNIKKKEGTGKVKGQAASIVGDVTVDLW